ncbi:outer membrane beta-barrel protein [Paraflavitalea pollutisoli]|uniref:outer membrane beta-barrel protein n=1 Tax=Paraflavitalea pollutisoli TaxID=3034143 RepID=UPI0023EDADB1|nr:outer membrane beta-barrel protein [Paraflavitalea sp. H1-2-19X]
MRYSVLLLTLLLVVSQTFAQEKGSVTGKLVDSAGKQALALATVTVFKAKDTSIITYRLSDPQGVFKVPGLPTNIPCRVVISFSGYAVVRREFELTGTSPNLDLGTLKMIPDGQSLDEVLVIAERPPVIIRKDTIEFNAAAFKTLPTALVEDLLKKLPGVEVDKDGNIIFNGRPINRITIEGKDFFGGDPKLATRNLPANIIDKIQVADDKDQLDQNPDINKSQLGQVLNLKLKRSIKQGLFGKLYAGAGTDDRYEAGGIVNMFRDTLQVSLLGFTNNLNRPGFGIGDVMSMGGFNRAGVNSMMVSSDGGFALNGVSFGGLGGGINKSTGGGINLNNEFGKKVTMNLQYFYGQNNTRMDQLNNTQQFFNDTSLTTRNDSRSVANEFTHRIGGSIRWKVDSFSTFRFSPLLTKRNNSSDRLLESFAGSNFEPLLNESHNTQRIDGSQLGYSHTIAFNRSFRKKDRSLYIGQDLNISDGTEDQYNNIVDTFYKSASKRTLDQLRDRNNRNIKASITFNYNEPIAKNLGIKLSGYGEYFKDKDALNTYNMDLGNKQYTVLNPDLSNTVNRSGTRTTLTTQLNWKIKQWSILPGVSYKSLNIDNEFAKNPAIDQQFNYILPALNINYKEWAFSYNVNINEPQATDLQPVIDNTNTLYQQLGNPYLVPTKSHQLYLRYNKFNPKSLTNFNGYLNGTISDDAVIRERWVDDKGVQITRPINLNGVWRFSGSMNASKQWKFQNKWQFTLRGSFFGNYNRNLVLVNNNSSEVKTWGLQPGLNWAFNYNDKVEFNQRYSVNFNKSSYENNIYPNLEVVTHYSSSEIVIRMPRHFVWESSIDYTYNPQTAPGVRKSNLRWNGGINYLFLKDDKGQLKLSVYDLLNQNISVSRTTRENYIQDNQTTVLRRYFLLTFTYNIRNFGAPPAQKVGGRNSLFMF